MGFPFIVGRSECCRSEDKLRVDLAAEGGEPAATEEAGGVAEQQIRRMERQAGVMERAAAEILVETA